MVYHLDAAFLLTIGSFLLTVEFFDLQLFRSFLTYSWSLFTHNLSFFTYSGQLLLISTLTDCKLRSSTVSKKAPTVNKTASPVYHRLSLSKGFQTEALGSLLQETFTCA